MKFKKLSLISCLAVFALMISLLGGCGSSKEAAKPDAAAAKTDGKAVVLKFACNTKKADLALGLPFAVAIDNFSKEVEKRTNGKYKVEVFWDSQLGNSAEEIIGGAQNGAFDMFSLALGSWGEYTDGFMPMNFPYLFKDNKTVYEFVDGSIGQKMKDNAQKSTKVKLLAFLDIGFRHITNAKREIKTPDDLKGLKIRTMSDPYQIAALQAMGATTTTTPWSEIYTALQTGVVDGQENPILNIKSARMEEVQKYLTLTGHTYTFTSMAISERALEKIPADIQKIIFEEARNAELSARKLTADVEAKTLADLKTKMTVYAPTSEQLDAFQEKAKAAWVKIEEKIGSQYYNEILAEVKKIEEKK